jgi:hypothetical protein
MHRRRLAAAAVHWTQAWRQQCTGQQRKLQINDVACLLPCSSAICCRRLVQQLCQPRQHSRPQFSWPWHAAALIFPALISKHWTGHPIRDGPSAPQRAQHAADNGGIGVGVSSPADRLLNAVNKGRLAP